jgi:hypothetical protein
LVQCRQRGVIGGATSIPNSEAAQCFAQRDRPGQLVARDLHLNHDGVFNEPSPKRGGGGKRIALIFSIVRVHERLHKGERPRRRNPTTGLR